MTSSTRGSSGKTPLFGLIGGDEVPGDGEMSILKQATVGYCQQGVGECAGHDAPGGRA